MRKLAAALLLATCACDTSGDVCDTRTADVGDICLPPSLAPGLPANIQLRESCGNGCSIAPTCTALFRNGAVFLDVTQDICVSYSSTSCLDQGCVQRTVGCTLPPLNAGAYTLTVPGGPARLLKVAPGGQSSCRFLLPDGGVQ
jgi:hypothetical protein